MNERSSNAIAQLRGRSEMSASAQLVTVEKLIARSVSAVADLRNQANYREQNGQETAPLRNRLTDAEATLEYLNDVLEALRAAVPRTPHQTLA
jgi:hypothetical protein